MPPTVIIIRHAQAQHNVTHNYDIFDPPLTSYGLNNECRVLSQHLQAHVPLAQEIDLIITSPLLRTIQTATHGLDWLIARGVPVHLRAEWQETSTFPCDIGRSIAELRSTWPLYNCSDIDPVFPSKTGLYEYSAEALERRGAAARQWLRERPEKVVAVVSHAGFLSACACYRRFGNADFRIFDFLEGEEERGGVLVEREVTEKSGGGLGKSPKGVSGFSPEDLAHFEKQKRGEA